MKHPSSVGKLLCFAVTLLLHSCSQPRSESDFVRVRWARDPERLDPLALGNPMAQEATYLLHLSLLQVDFSRHTHAPALVESLPVVKFIGDSLTQLQYRLRPAAAWSNGRPVLTTDVAFTLKLLCCPGLPNEAARAQFGFIREIIPDPTNPRRFTLVCRGQSVEYAPASGDFPILSEAALDPRGVLRRFSLAAMQQPTVPATLDSARWVVARQYRAANLAALPGCGPYQLVKWERDRYLRFRRKPTWWADQLQPVPLTLQARPRELDFLIIPDAATAALALRRGDLDVYPQIPAREFERLRASPAARAGLRFYTTSSYDVLTAGFNTRRPALADALTRQALSRCFDAAGLLKATQLGGGQRSVGIISPTDNANYNDSLPLLPFDPAGARGLLRRAGWQQSPGAQGHWFRRGPQGRQALQLGVRYRAEDDLFATVALQFQAAAAGLGIPVTLQPTEAGAFSAAVNNGDFDVYVRVLKGNPFIFNFIPILHSLGVGEGNTTGFSTPASDQLIEAIATAPTPARRAQLLHRFQALMQYEAPLVPLFFLPNRVVADRRLSGLYASSLRPGYSVTTLERSRAPQPPAK